MTLKNITKAFFDMMILKVKTENAQAAELFCFDQDGKRQSRETVSMQEVQELSHAGRLHSMTGKEVANMDDIGLFSFLEFYSYYQVQPLTV